MMTQYTHSMHSRFANTIPRVLLTASIAFAVLGLASASRASAEPVPGDPAPLAVVNGDTITTADLDRQLIGLHKGMSAAQKQSFDYRKLLTKLVNDRLLCQEARALGIHEDSALQKTLREQWDRQVIGLYARDHFKPDLAIPEARIESYFDRYYRRMQLRTLAVRTLAEAQQIALAIRSGHSMDSIAKEASLDLYRYGGGLHSNKYYGDIERVLRDPADRLKTGELSEPFPFRDAYALVRVERRTPADRDDLDDHRARIESVLRQKARQEQWARFIADLSETYPPRTDARLIDALKQDAGSLFTPGFTEGSEEPIVFVADGPAISDRRLRVILSRSAMEAAQSPYDSLFAKALDYACEEVVLKAAAFALGYPDKPSIRRGYAESLDSALIEIYLQETVVPQIAFTREEFDRYYAEHLSEFTTSPTCQFRQMIVEDEAVAKTIYHRLKTGADFAYLAKQYDATLSTPEESADWIPLESFPTAIRAEIEGLRIGQTTAPHATSTGWLLLKLKGYRDGTPKPIGECETTIQSRLFQDKFDAILDTTLSVLKDHSTLWYNDDRIETYFGADS